MLIASDTCFKNDDSGISHILLLLVNHLLSNFLSASLAEVLGEWLLPADDLLVTIPSFGSTEAVNKYW
jgi:hypothetical protein